MGEKLAVKRMSVAAGNMVRSTSPIRYHVIAAEHTHKEFYSTEFRRLSMSWQ